MTLEEKEKQVRHFLFIVEECSLLELDLIISVLRMKASARKRYEEKISLTKKKAGL